MDLYENFIPARPWYWVLLKTFIPSWSLHLGALNFLDTSLVLVLGPFLNFRTILVGSLISMCNANAGLYIGTMLIPSHFTLTQLGGDFGSVLLPKIHDEAKWKS
jgi:hypothetical protein